MIEATILYSFLMLLVFMMCGAMGLIYAAAWVSQRVSWDVALVLGALGVWAVWWAVR